MSKEKNFVQRLNHDHENKLFLQIRFSFSYLLFRFEMETSS